MEFCLFYQGELPSNGTKHDKQRIRSEIAPQLKVLWNQEPLQGLWEKRNKKEQGLSTLIRTIGAHNFLPIVTDELHLYAEISIDMIRPGRPGSLIQGGDIDNRLKTLFDALRMPNTTNELVGDPAPNGSPLPCLLEDDRFITRVDVTTHQLLLTLAPGHVMLLMKVILKKNAVTWENIGL